ncbi:acyltransferase domain-containing protein [Propionibacteriaceae bacterium G1746]
MHLHDRLDRTDWPERLTLLGVEDEDRAPLLRAVGAVLADEDLVARTTWLAEHYLLPWIGAWRGVFERDGFWPGEVFDPAMAGAQPLCALLATVDDVRAFHASRGIDGATSWASLADLGQQVAKHRAVTGRTGLTHFNWLRNVWAGCYIRLGRLQFELYRSDLDGALSGPVTMLNTHIPAGGSMAPGLVDESLLRAPAFFREHFGDQLDAGGLDWLTCWSWLLDPQLAQLLPGSNVADFAARWQACSSSGNDRDGYYFVFDIEPLEGAALPYGVDELPQRTSLERALVGLWRSGGHLQRVRGRIRCGQVRVER